MAVDQVDDDLAPSLDLYAISVAEEGKLDGLKACPRKLDWRWVHLVSGEMRHARCRANFCPFCGPVNASLVGGALTLAGVERMGTLTQVGNTWQVVRPRMKRLAYDLRRAGRSLDWGWHVEPNPKGTGHHVHFFQRGDFLPQQELSRLADKNGMGKVADIRKWEAKGRAAGYGLKLAGIGYGLKQTQAEATMRTYLRANGGRLVHTTRAFWRDLDGQAVGQREAMVAWAKRAGPSEDDDQWRLVRVA